ncbi:hypothetical protein DFQ01_14418 [Paenibacillus cellulosilyticus]|uniref:DUF6906 domain-containing protein n=1 Tax=Paenibacillus cellulosilyticus TaxID=375489 RepID=A0A2V2YGV4_9BACL|nr:hypothetical protein [Paenibacillus cellulosilyticus]PWV90242.1 hypothetical protein DFQ01_14418 [Paenibacillus cellulosilyticus]QKS43400.1 hypothetical protein HUB94_02445 [Paenibacillus cellulosilyticus]
MKHGKNPTRRQKMGIQAAGLTSDNWLVVKDLPGEMTIVHRLIDQTRVIFK